ncbi:hypothetical protein CU313_06755 [Prochlorococcus marinus str. MU1404]|uniref:O-antigen ligase family protein n=1 Tax=Prochlorococcus marinus TaxID=1219 RepID=UPI001AD9847D|nr:O-antigen ligase family protein [Prochlorococcus marinus]MBO8230521.1 O-antigen ligase family protein [Prochlorococcus marinus XMU1404]MBW3073567.1 hypothetical protein [Prochlorococcus marinus str. MU1404]MCR8545145.1 O-antigen ligase family protein [Prochlorococcus marinus CUG1432]
MRIIEKLKSSVFHDYYSKQSFLFQIGLRLFQTGILFLAAAPVIAFFLLLVSSIFGGLIREENYFSDKYNFAFVLVTLLMLLNCLFLTFNTGKAYSPEASNIWIGLSNWIPFFWCFWGFQTFLKSYKLRLQAAKILIFGSLPVLVSGFCQYFLKIYGPYKFFNSLIVWYQRPLGDDNGVTGIFNNQNYAGAWLSIILPLCLLFLIKKNRTKITSLFILFNSLSFMYMIVLTSSRGAILSIFTSIFLITKSLRNKVYILLSLFSIPFILNLIPLFSINLQSKIYNFLPFELIKKASITKFSSLDFFPRIEIWSKSFNLIKSNLITGYGAGSFKDLYSLSEGRFGDIQHSHNIFLEIAINHGLPSSLLIFMMMIFITIICWIKNSNKDLHTSFNIDIEMMKFNNAWIISFIVFFIIHIFDITYFDGRISTLAWILLSGMRSIIRENSVSKKID